MRLGHTRNKMSVIGLQFLRVLENVLCVFLGYTLGGTVVGGVVVNIATRRYS